MRFSLPGISSTSESNAVLEPLKTCIWRRITKEFSKANYLVLSNLKPGSFLSLELDFKRNLEAEPHLHRPPVRDVIEQDMEGRRDRCQGQMSFSGAVNDLRVR